ncbi:MAG: hypothetical protein IJH51_03835 [Christensenellaceae bacterium]|nr:hypothetical protein [Christensenellaceae bacterium]
MKRSLIIALCLVLCAVLVLTGCDERIRAEVEEEYGSDTSVIAVADAPDMTIIDAGEAAETQDAGIDATEVFADKAMEKGEKGLIDYRKGAEEETEEKELIAPKDENAYYGIRWDEPDEVEIETLPDGYDQINNRDDKLLASLDYPVFKADDSDQMIAYGRVLDKYGRDTDESGWYVFAYSSNIIFRDPTAEELKKDPVPEGYELIGESSDLPRCLGFGLYAEALDYEPGDAGEDDADLEVEKKNALKGDKSLIAPAEESPAMYYAYGDSHDLSTGKVSETGWFQVFLDKTPVTKDNYECLIPGQILVCREGEEDFEYFTAGEDDIRIRRAVRSGSYDEMYVVTIVAGSDPPETAADLVPEGYEFKVDVPAYSYKEPVYETQWVAVCDDCGEVIEGAPEAHIAAELEKGGKGGYHNEPRQVQTGEREVNVPDAGHYEKIG